MIKAPPATKWNFLSLGAGVQSSTLALMAAKGEVTPMPDAAIFADTQAEPGYQTRNNPKDKREGIYGWLDWLSDQLPFPVYTVTKGDLTADSLKPHTVKKEGSPRPIGSKYIRQIIPLFGQMPNGKITAALGRRCTEDYKIHPVHRKIRELAAIKRGQKEITVTQWIGISWDEMQRMRDSRQPWIQHRFPLIEKRTERHHCLAWMRENNFPTPPRSACFYCPFHSNGEWRHFRDNDPQHFSDAINFDNELRRLTKKHEGPGSLKMEVFLHRSCKPLDEVDFSTDIDRGQQTWDFKAECEGMCGV